MDFYEKQLKRNTDKPLKVLSQCNSSMGVVIDYLLKSDGMSTNHKADRLQRADFKIIKQSTYDVLYSGDKLKNQIRRLKNDIDETGIWLLQEDIKQEDIDKIHEYEDKLKEVISILEAGRLNIGSVCELIFYPINELCSYFKYKCLDMPLYLWK